MDAAMKELVDLVAHVEHCKVAGCPMCYIDTAEGRRFRLHLQPDAIHKLAAVVREQEAHISELEFAAKKLAKEWDAHVVSLGFGRYSVTGYVFNAVKQLHALVERKDYEW